MRPSPTLTEDEVIAIWQRRCDKYKAWNRGWIIAALAWLAVMAALLACAYLGPPASRMLAGVICGTLFLTGFAVFQMASWTLLKLLRCPSCGTHVETRGAGVESVRQCSHCGVALRFDALPDAFVPATIRRPAA